MRLSVPLLFLALAACNKNSGTETGDTVDCTEFPDDPHCDGSETDTEDTTVGELDIDDDGDGVTENQGDCNDADDAVNPSASEECNDEDDNCNGETDEGLGVDWFADSDGDGYGDAGAVQNDCEAPEGYVDNSGDCNDDDTLVHPGADEVCNASDDDCDGKSDEGLPKIASFRDFDGDGFGDYYDMVEDCMVPEGYVADDSDCDDVDAEIYPGATEVCNLSDDDCDGKVDEDLEADWYADVDGDGYGDPSTLVTDCLQPEHYIETGGDCDDATATTYPYAPEYCNDVDDDCDTEIDEEAVDGAYFAVDADDDGFGDPTLEVYDCEGITNKLDCDDADASEPKVADLSIGTTAGPGTLTAPYDTIQGAIDASTKCVVVQAGTYNEAIDFSGKDISVTGIDGSSDTTIDASSTSSSPVVSFVNAETSAASLSGFTLTGGTGRLETESESTGCGSGETCTTYYSTYAGGGILIDGSYPTLTDLVITGNSLPAASSSTSGNDTYYTYSFGGGVCVLSGYGVLLEGVDLYENTADQGGGLYADAASTVQLEQSAIMANTATDGGGVGLDGSTMLMSNVLSAWNTASDMGGGVYASGGTFGAWNVTWGFDSATDGGGVYLTSAVAATINSSIIYSAPAGYGILVEPGATLDGQYNNVYNNTPDNYSGVTDPTGTYGNISSDPTFGGVSNDGDAYNDDWSLTAGSPSIDAGDPSIGADPDGTTADQGAYGGSGGSWK